MYNNDQRIVMTLDAGGTNLVFSAMQGCKEVVEPVLIPTTANDLDQCLVNIRSGFEQVIARLEVPPCAISFAFPGPADYPNGIIGGQLPNMPVFRGGVALGPFLEEAFGLPVFINNDGDLFAYGEALAGALPEINAKLEAAGSNKRYNNMTGVTFGTGFGGGVVTNGRLHLGDNSAGGDVWCFCNKIRPDLFAEEGVSIRAVKRVYRELSNDCRDLTPKQIFDIAEGDAEGDADAAIGAFAQLGEVAGNTLAEVATIVDGLIVIGGGLAAAHKYFMPALLAEMNGEIGAYSGDRFNRMQVKVFDIDNDFDNFARGQVRLLKVPYSNREVAYDPVKRIGVTISKLGASRAVSVGAYVFALSQIDSNR